MPRKGFRPEEVIAKQREADVPLGRGKGAGEVVGTPGVSEVNPETSGPSHRASRQSGDRAARASGPVLIGLFAYCVLLSALAAAFAAAFATAPYWIPGVVSVWWAP
jgi:hypothetical protein